MRKHIKRELQAEAAKIGVRVDFDDTGKHPKVIVSLNGKTAQFTVSRTPSDVYAVNAMLRDLRRFAKSLGDQPPS